MPADVKVEESNTIWTCNDCRNISSLIDVYQLLKTPNFAVQTSLMLQFLWHDLTSNYDIIGPYSGLETVKMYCSGV